MSGVILRKIRKEFWKMPREKLSYMEENTIFYTVIKRTVHSLKQYQTH